MTFRRLRDGLFLFAAYLALIQPAVSAAPGPLPQCDTVCSESEACETECQNDLFETTCENYNGGSSNGQCVGYCGDYYCNAYNGENSSTCEDDCFESCTPDWEVVSAGPGVYGIQVTDIANGYPNYDYDCTYKINHQITLEDQNACYEDYDTCSVTSYYAYGVYQGYCEDNWGPVFGYPFGSLTYCPF